MRDVAAISRDLANRTEDFCRVWFPRGRKVGNYWQMADTTGEAGRSLAIRLRPSGGRPAGKWSDFATGENGDLLDLIEAHTGSTYRDVLAQARSFLGQPDTSQDDKPAVTSEGTRPSDKIIAGRNLFSYGRSWRKTPAERYLRRRGICRFGSALAYHRHVFFLDTDGECDGLPALLAAITDNYGVVTGCARTFLDIQRTQVAAIENPKRVLGRLHGNAIRFSHWPGAEDLLAGEGLENVLSVGSALPLLDLASCLTANHLGLFDPPPTIKRLWIARDNDEAGEWAASRLRTRAEPMGIDVFDLVPASNDFNRDLLNDGLIGLRRRLTANMRECAPEILQTMDRMRRER